MSTTTWIVVAVVGVVTVCCKAAGPVLLGRRELPGWALRLVELLAPVMLSALVVTQTVGGDSELVLDGPRLAGVGAAAVALRLGASLLPVMVIAAATAAFLRLVV